MSQELDRDARLTALVLSQTTGHCALARAASAMNCRPRCLVEFAATIGYSAAEARGIMSGWDEAAGRVYMSGLMAALGAEPHAIELGRKLYALAQGVRS